MNHFKLVPVGSPTKPISFDAASVAAVLDLIDRRKLGDTDVHQDGRYKFSVSYDAAGAWTLTQTRLVPMPSRRAAPSAQSEAPPHVDAGSVSPAETAAYG